MIVETVISFVLKQQKQLFLCCFLRNFSMCTLYLSKKCQMSKMATNEDLLLRLDKTIMGIDPNRPHMSRHPQLHKGMNPVFMTMRSEMHYLKKLNIEVIRGYNVKIARLTSKYFQERRRKLKQLQIQDFLQQDKELRQVGLAFINRFQ